MICNWRFLVNLPVYSHPSLTFYANINLHMFQDVFVVKKRVYNERWILFFFCENFRDQINDRRFWQSKHDRIYHVAKVKAATSFHG